MLTGQLRPRSPGQQWQRRRRRRTLGASPALNPPPRLAAFAYVLIPMPYLFFGQSSGGYGGGGWSDFGKFLTG